MNILLTGSMGYVGSSVLQYLSQKYNIISINRNILDLRDTVSIKRWFDNLGDNYYFDAVIHTAIKGGNRLEVDNSSILDDNIRMYLNLLNHKDRYNKFINIGSGAEVSDPQSYYGMSKNVINTSMQDKNNFYNLRIYGIFDANEIERRFIKNNIKNYLNQQNLVIYQNKYMDFIYLPDFIRIIQTYLERSNLPKNFDCVYENKYTLIHIANFINHLDQYRVNIDIQDNRPCINYTGHYYNLGIEYIGLKQGIEETYQRIKNEKNMVCS